MLKALLERRFNQRLTNEEFETILDITTADIKFNRINFKKCTSLHEVLNIAGTSLIILQRDIERR
ncbi:MULTISPECIES: hypothetical protein [Clostridium]|uniref:Uncharacterized protein n=2 Tax=Clostridium TaxID=1485 RepID=A0A9Q1UXX6_CLOBO|nr:MULTISPECIES: hypothetical protein [Clostridium]AEB75870.1 conserved hypothetical protein [Clostridium botulinum BKT015925]KEH97186.1 hypothetical protein Z953_02500 [Clostridium botulinum D str. 16868]KEI04704.1 hypothetical protein Y848_00650 [Clostridium botulinum C/D str. Sp77]KEI16956.1 hypothetical protein Z959_08155 [Clostridium novyi B str. ATCC 27606]KLU76926.1 hypothetical protein CBC3_01075 [Clostridium botulinum V891]